jgi:hypothetical protein
MTSQLELNSRATLCRQLARREPANRVLWLAEAENWLRLSKGSGFRNNKIAQVLPGERHVEASRTLRYAVLPLKAVTNLRK